MMTYLCAEYHWLQTYHVTMRVLPSPLICKPSASPGQSLLLNPNSTNKLPFLTYYLRIPLLPYPIYPYDKCHLHRIQKNLLLPVRSFHPTPGVVDPTWILV